jgi:hypothetical protein
VSLSFPVIFAAFVLEDLYLGKFPLLDYSGLNLHAIHKRLAHAQLVPVGEQEHLIEGNVFPHFAANLFHFDYMPEPGFVLPPAGPEDGVHRFESSSPAYLTKFIAGKPAAANIILLHKKKRPPPGRSLIKTLNARSYIVA